MEYKALAVVPAALLLGCLIIPTLPAQEILQARVAATNGRVEVREVGGEVWQPLESGQVLPLGATVSTGFGATAQLEIGPSTLEVRPLSRLTIEELVEREGLVQSSLFLQVGRVQAEVRGTAGRQSEFRLSSPVATAAVRGTSFEFDGVNLQVQTGTVRLVNRFGESISVSGGESSSSTDGETPTPPSEEREAATAVRVFVSPPGEPPRTEGARGSSDAAGSTGGSMRVNWTIEDYDEDSYAW